MKTKSRSDRSKSKRPVSKPQRKKPASKQSALPARLTRADHQELCEEIVGGILEDDRRRSLEARPAVDPDLLAMVRERASRTLFYPHPPDGYDWNPLYHLSHLCDTFMFVDLLRNGNQEDQESIRQKLQNIHTLTPVGDGLRCVGAVTDLQPGRLGFQNGVAGLAGLGNQPHQILRDEAEKMRAQGSWGLVANVTRTVGDTRTRGYVRRPLKVLYLRAGGVSAYLALFYAQKLAPRAICFRQSCPQWNYFTSRNGLFAEVVHGQGAETDYLFGWDSPLCFRRWAWNQPFMNFNCWHAQNDVTPDCLGAWLPVTGLVKRGHLEVPDGFTCTFDDPDSRRKVILIKGRLQPGNIAEGVGAVVVSQQLPVTDLRAGLHRFVLQNDDLRSPLSTILEQITGKCEQRGVSAVASIGIGYEDESPALRQWLSRKGTPLSLTIYCPTDGDFFSLAGMLG